MNKNLFYENKIREILTKAGFKEVEAVETDKGKIFSIRKSGEDTSLAIAVSHPEGYEGSSVNEEIRKIREHLLEQLGANIQTVCTIDDTGGILLIEGKPIGEINRIDGVMEADLDSIIDILPEPQI